MKQAVSFLWEEETLSLYTVMVKLGSLFSAQSILIETTGPCQIEKKKRKKSGIFGKIVSNWLAGNTLFNQLLNHAYFKVGN